MDPRICTLIIVLLAAPMASAQDGIVELGEVDLETTLDGSAFFISVGPAVQAEVRSEIGILTGERRFRVTLFRVERSFRIRLESIVFTRGGGSRVEWASDVFSRSLHDVCPAPCRISAEGFAWLGPRSFEFVDAEPTIDVRANTLIEAPRHLRIEILDSRSIALSCDEVR